MNCWLANKITANFAAKKMAQSNKLEVNESKQIFDRIYLKYLRVLQQTLDLIHKQKHGYMCFFLLKKTNILYHFLETY